MSSAASPRKRHLFDDYLACVTSRRGEAGLVLEIMTQISERTCWNISRGTKLLFCLAEDENTIQIREGDTKNTTTTLPIAVSTCRSTSVSKALKTHLPKQGYRWCEGSFGPIQTEAAACSLQVRGDQPLLIFAGGEAGDFSARQLFSSTNICAAVYSPHYYSHDTNTAFTSTEKKTNPPVQGP